MSCLLFGLLHHDVESVGYALGNDLREGQNIAKQHCRGYGKD